MNLTFLGTGGGRFTMIKQLRRTAGMHLVHGDHSLYIDPGPGALVHALEEGIDLKALDGIVVSHAHLDHCGDMNALIEAMTDGGDAEHGQLYVSRSVADGVELEKEYTDGEGTYGTRIDPVLDGFHRDLVNTTTIMAGGDTHEIGPYTMECLNTQHSDPSGIAFSLDTGETKAVWVTDTGYFDGLVDFCTGADVVILNVARPAGKPWGGHLTTSDAAEILNAAEPDHGILQHFGAAFIYGSIPEQKAFMDENTEVPVTFATDGMQIDLAEPRSGLDAFM